VATAQDGEDALSLAASWKPDLILLDVMMPGMDGFETCRRLKADPVTRHIPVVLVTALDGREDKLKGLDAGADDFVTKPIDDVILFARVRSLLRLKSVMDELREREESGRRLGVDTDGAGRLRGSGGRILIVDDNARQVQKMLDHLSGEHRPMVESDPAAALIAARGPVDLMIVNISSAEFDGLRLVAQMRSTDRARRIPILAVVDPADRSRLLKALELGVNDILPRPVDSEELEAREQDAAVLGPPLCLGPLDHVHATALVMELAQRVALRVAKSGREHRGQPLARVFVVRVEPPCARARHLPCKRRPEA
jgi:two-component system cell cycle response regulator